MLHLIIDKISKIFLIFQKSQNLCPSAKSLSPSLSNFGKKGEKLAGGREICQSKNILRILKPEGYFGNYEHMRYILIIL